MTTLSRPLAVRIRGLAVAALTVAGLAGLLAACSSSQAAAPQPAPSAVHATCDQVSAVLSDGPDPGEDPVGYAEAQILPLAQIRTSDRELGSAISRLARAYRAFFDSKGASAAAKVAVADASKQVNAICPGAA
jgi:hypothetical protein